MPAAQTAMEKKKRSFAMPHVFVILTIIMLLVWAISFFVPSGNFERVLDPNSGREIVNPDVFNFVEKEYIMPDTFFQTFYNGIVGGISIMANLLIVSGVLGVLESTGAFSAGIHKLVRATKGKELSSGGHHVRAVHRVRRAGLRRGRISLLWPGGHGDHVGGL